MKVCRRPRSRLVLALAFAATLITTHSEDSVMITEFMTQNETTLKDDTGEYSDWIEVFNGGTNTVNLGGYSLTDDAANLSKWRFPATNLAAGRYLIVFASGLDRAIAGKPLHTNFKLDAAGEYLGLVKPDGLTIVSQFAPAYPAQDRGRSYGLAVEDITGGPLISQGASVRYLVPTNNIGTAWTQTGFDDSNWTTATTALKFDRGTGTLSYDNVNGTDIESGMAATGPSVYVRVPFAGIDISRVTDFQLFMRYDDGFVAYLNGQEIARRLAPTSLVWNAAATGVRSNDVALVAESINLIDSLNLIQPGANVLAIHGLNRSFSDSDFLLLPELTARNVKVLTNVHRYFATPTPGAANTAGLPGTAGSVRFSRKSTTFVETFPLALEASEPGSGAVIRYTLDRSVPNENSPLYSAPLNISTSVMVRARVFAPGLFAGPHRTESYVALNSTVVNVTSDLPILVIHSFGGGRVNGTAYNGAFMMIHEPIRGRSALTNAPQLTTRAALKDRGSSTAGQVKANYAVELWDEENQARNLPILGMPAESDWVFHSPYNFDPALIRNPLAYEMGHQLGRYASRYRFVEVYVNAGTTSGPLTSANYAGVYNILEKIKRGKDRVDVDELRPGDVQAPEVTGGYLLKIDRLDPGDGGLNAGGRQVAYVEPKEPEIELPERDPQEKYIIGYLNSFWNALRGANFTDPKLGYAPFIDAGAWIDHHIVDALTWNVDALRLSSYFRKVRNGPLVYGPLWDFDRSLGSTDGRDANPRVWGDTFFTDVWWSRLYRDPNFWQRWIDRWQDVRQAQFSNQSIIGIIDSLAAQVREAAPRDFAKWRQTKRGGTQQSEIEFTKNWLLNRLDFFDTNLLSKPLLSHAGGPLSPGFALALAGPPGATVYYTLDGSDPRQSGGLISPTALIYTGPIPLASTTVVKARSRNLNHKNLTLGNNPPISSPWSGLTQARFSSFPPATADKIAVTEIMFNPAAPSPQELGANAALTADDFEFIEIKNVSAESLDLFGARFVSGIEFSFTGSAAETLASGRSVLLVKSRPAFSARYGERPNIAGEFGGGLDNNGERLRLVNGSGATVLDFEYRAAWHPITDGQGFSLVPANENAAAKAAGQRSSWRPSVNPGGSPGQADPVAAVLPPVVINEVLANTDRKDVIELHNPTTSSANIGGWFLTDDRRVPKKFRIPDGTVLPPGGFLIFDDDAFDSSKRSLERFSFSRFGEGAYLFSAGQSGNLLGYTHGFEFGASEEGVTFGRFVTSAGEERFVAQASPSLNVANVGPKVGPLVISEIMYHPPDVFLNRGYWDNEEDEFIELQNSTDQPVSLFAAAHPTNTWNLRSAVNFDFPANVKVAAKGFVLLVGFDPAADAPRLSAFRSRFAVPPDAMILGPYSGKLDNSSDTIRLFKPGEPGSSSSSNGTEVPRILVDSVEYGDQLPWPAAADGIGHSLQRLSATSYGDDSANWGAFVPTPGAANRQSQPLTFAGQPSSQTALPGSSVTFTAQAKGAGALKYQWRFAGTILHEATNATLTINNVKPADAGEYVVVAMNGESSAASLPAVLTVLPTPTITVQPIGRNVNPGTNWLLGVTARGTGLLKFQWRFNGSSIPGATAASLLLTNLQMADSGFYNVIVTDSVGSTLSEPAVVNVLVRPQIIVQPESQLALEGDTVTLRVSTLGTPPLYYHWRRDGINVANATNSMFLLRNVQMADSGIYSVSITNIATGRNSIFSDDATVAVFADADQDRMADLWELANGFSTIDAGDASRDADGDGLTNLQEYLAGTDPRDRQSFLKLDGIKTDGATSILEFTARSNRNYTIQFKPTLSGGAWINLTNYPGRPVNRVETFTEAVSPKTNRFYRLVTPAVP